MSHFTETKARQRSNRALAEYRATKALGGELTAAASGTTGFGGSFAQDARTREAYGLFKNWVYVAVNAIAKRLAGQPICAGEVVGSSANPERNAHPGTLKNRVPSRLVKAAEQQNLEVLTDHPALDAFARPNNVQKRFEFLYSSAVNILITGEAYWIGGTTDDKEGGNELELWSVPTTWIKAKHEGGLFTGYDLHVGTRKIPLPPENVARTYYPHPSDLRLAWSPLFSIHQAVMIDEHIINSQKQNFERGIYPNMVVTIGRERGPDGKLSDRRPVLKGHHRRQIIQSIREIWNEQVNAGDPAIIDGLIESVHPMSTSPREMNWLESGDSVKRRVMQAYQVNPISVGETIGANRAQAAEAERQVCAQAVNPLAETFSETATDFVGPMFDKPERLEIWIDKAEPVDMELELKRWTEGRKNKDVSKDEFRSNVLGLGPDEREERNELVTQIAGFTSTTALMQAVGNGTIDKLVASRMFQLFFELEEEVADQLAGMDIEEEEPAPPPPALAPPPAGGGEQEPPPEEPAEEAEELQEISAAARLLESKLEDQHEHIVAVATTMMQAVEDTLGKHAKGE